MTQSRTKPPQQRTTRAPTARPRRPVWALAGAGVIVIVGGALIAVLASRSGDDDSGSAQASGGFTGGDFHSLVADPSMPARVFVGGHQAVSVSDDGGRSWLRLDALDDADAMGWGFAGSTTWVSGHPGIVVSTDDGEAVQGRNDALPDTDIHALGAGEGVLYAAGPGVGVIVSRDDAATWQSASTSDGQSFFGRILVDATTSDHLVAADAARGPVESNDGGQTWNVLVEFPTTWVSAADEFQMIYASGPQGAIMSDDGGASWAPVALPPLASLVEADPHTSGRLYAGVHDGERVTVYISDDQGRSWRQP